MHGREGGHHLGEGGDFGLAGSPFGDQVLLSPSVVDEELLGGDRPQFARRVGRRREGAQGLR